MMIKVIRNRLWLAMVLILAFSMAAGIANAALFGLIKSKKKAAPVITESLVIFPFDMDTESSKLPESFGQDLAIALRSTLAGNDHYWVYLFTEHMAPVKRAVGEADSGLKAKDIEGPFAENAEVSLGLAKVLAADYLISGTVEDYRVEKDSNSAQVTLSVNLINANTGKVVRRLLVTGRTPDGASSDGVDDARALAAGDAVVKLKTQLFEEEPAPSESDSTAKKDPEPSPPEEMPVVQSAK